MTMALEIRVRGRVQGVGFRPTVWRMASELGLRGEVFNDGEGVVVRAGGSRTDLEALIARMQREPPPLGRIDTIETREFLGPLPASFRIAESQGGPACTEITPDAAICTACAAEVFDPFERRFRYPFTNCTHCGPRLSIIDAIPYDRARTAMAPFLTCNDCAAEYHNPADRRFHAEAIACHACGPRAKLVRLDGRAMHFEQHSMLDDVDAACGLLQKGEIVAIKGLGGYQIACDATNAAAVAKLRARKRRDAKPFALMARDLDVIREFCAVSGDEAALLGGPESPIVLLDRTGAGFLPEAIAPGLTTLGFMLPTTPLHLLMLRGMNRPVVMTSGNISGAPQVIDDAEMVLRLAGVVDYALVHDRRIASRMDDSVARVMADRPRLLRRARGYAPSPVAIPEEFAVAPPLLALGGELKSTFCLLSGNQAILSQHQGDLEDVSTRDDFATNLALYTAIFQHAPAAIVIDRHPDYASSKLGRKAAAGAGIGLIETQHHHAHIAGCLAENLWPLNAPPVLGIVLDGAGLGDVGTIWGGEFLAADYRGFTHLGTFRPVALPGGDQAMREPWRNLYAHLMAQMGWAEFEMNFADLEIFADLAARPRRMLDTMIAKNLNAPLASSCGRLFDAVAAALGLCRDAQSYEGQAAAQLEALVDMRTLLHEDEALGYDFAIPKLRGTGLPYIEPLGMWRGILGDLILRTPTPVIAARFHKGLAAAIVRMTVQLAGSDAQPQRFDTVALSGGCFQNKILFEEIIGRLSARGFRVLTHARTPPNDGGLALGQAVIGAAYLMQQ